MTPRRAMFKLQDPDQSGIDFSTDTYLHGELIDVVPGPREMNWVLKLDVPLECRDANRRSYMAQYFLLKPNGLDAEQIMRSSPENVTHADTITVLALFVPDKTKLPTTILDPQSYRQFPLIASGSQLLLGENKENKGRGKPGKPGKPGPENQGKPGPC